MFPQTVLLLELQWPEAIPHAPGRVKAGVRSYNHDLRSIGRALLLRILAEPRLIFGRMPTGLRCRMYPPLRPCGAHEEAAEASAAVASWPLLLAAAAAAGDLTAEAEH